MAVTLLLGVDNRALAVLLQQIGMNLSHLQRTIDRRDVQHRHQPVRAVVAGIHQHLRPTRGQHLKAQGFEHRHLADDAGQFRMGITFEHLPQHRPRHALAPMAFTHPPYKRSSKPADRPLTRQIQQETDDFLRILRIGCHDQFDGQALGAIHRLQIEMHLITDAILIEVVEADCSAQWPPG